MILKIWGARGSIPVCEKTKMKYGGNTSCVEVKVDDNIIIFDAGTGIRKLGDSLSLDENMDFHIFISHYHLDHIMGLPYFKPIHKAGNKINIYGHPDKLGLKKILTNVISPPYFPINMNNFVSEIEFMDTYGDQKIQISENVEVKTISNIHTDDGLYYKVCSQGKSISYITDVEVKAFEEEQALIEFIENSDLVIFDAAYTEEEYKNGKEGWGHSTWQMAVEIAKKACVKKLVLFHHSESRTDLEMDDIEKMAKKQFQDLIVAREGQVISV